MEQKRTKIIKNKDYVKLWKAALAEEDRDTFIRCVQEWNYKKYKLNYEEFIYMLMEIHKNAHISFKEILDSENMKKSEIANAFCVPIRTVEDWYSGKNKCPDYFRLLLLRYFHKENLGKYIRVEVVSTYNTSIPRIYDKQNDTKKETTDYIMTNRYDDRTKEAIEQSIATRLLLQKTEYIGERINRRKEK